MAPAINHWLGKSLFPPSWKINVPEERNICRVLWVGDLGVFYSLLPVWGQGCGPRKGSLGVGSAQEVSEVPL